MARTLALLLFGLTLALPTTAAFASDVPYGILIDGRPLDATHRSGLNRSGVLYVNVVRIVKTFDGLLTFDGGLVRVSLGGRTMVFTIGSRDALLDGRPFHLSGPPFKVQGDTYVPLAPIATLGRATLSVDRHARQATLQLGSGEGFAQPVPTGSAESDVQPSPAQALSFVTSATTDADGLHARVDIANLTAKPYTIAFPTSAQIAFVLSKDGAEVWNSGAGERPAAPSTLTLDARATKTVVQTWAGFSRLGSGRFTLRVRLLTATPLDTAPISLGVTTPGPAATS